MGNDQSVSSSSSSSSSPVKRGNNFVQLSPEIMHDIMCFMSVDDLAIRGFLNICKSISLNMLGISNIDDLETQKDIVNCSQYYTTLTFLTMRKNVERFTFHVKNRRKFIIEQGDFTKVTHRARESWNKLTLDEKQKVQNSESISSRSRDVHYMNRRVQTKPSEYTSSKLFYRLTSSISDLNKLFPHWLSPKKEFDDLSLMKTYMEQHKSVHRLYKTLFNLKTINIPIVFLGDDEEQLYNSINAKLNTILFDTKRFSKSVNKSRNWKLIFEKQLARSVHLRLTETIFKMHKFCRKLLKPKSLTFFNTHLNTVMTLLEKLDEKSRMHYLFQRSYAHGKRTQNNQKRPNDHVGLLQDLLYLFTKVRNVAKTRNKITNAKNSAVMVRFFRYALSNWKIFYRIHHKNSEATTSESEIVRQFLMDGPRIQLKTITLLEKTKILDLVIDELKPVFEEHFPNILTASIWHQRRKNINKLLYLSFHLPIRSRTDGTFKDL